ncbi:MAG: hypothetical protein ABWY08_08070 [Comamonas sp.]
MKYRLLEVASGTQPLHLHLPEEISAFEDLRSSGLVAGTIRAPADAVIYSLTPDGRAVLALRRCRLARRSGDRQGA